MSIGFFIMCRLYAIVSFTIICLVVLVSRAEAGISVSLFFQQPAQEIILPPEEYVDCYAQRPVIYQGVLYRGRSICEHRFIPARAVWISENRHRRYYHNYYR